MKALSVCYIHMLLTRPLCCLHSSPVSVMIAFLLKVIAAVYGSLLSIIIRNAYSVAPWRMICNDLFVNHSIYIIIRHCSGVGAFPRPFCVPNSVALASLTLQVGDWAIH